MEKYRLANCWGYSMGDGIQPLPIDVVHLIAAGEVIDSPAAVVRELAENALDAGATRITIALDVAQGRIRVTDNGCGMTLEDLQQAAAPHSTSKIRDRQDLGHISSLGFRGEALHSLAQLSDLTICSRHQAAAAGWQLVYNSQGQVQQADPIALAPGTTVTAHNLFANWLVRRQGLPTVAQQLRGIQTVVQHLALCHPQVTWQVQQSDRDWFSLFPSQTARAILPQLLRNLQWGDLADRLVTPEQPFYLLLGLPDRAHRRRPDWIQIALNGRMVRLPELEQTILASFRRTLPRDRYPICFVHLQAGPDQIDWNRHPAKSEVYLQQLEGWRTHVAAAIAQTLELKPDSLAESYQTTRLQTLFKTAEAASPYGPEPVPSDVPSPTGLRAIAQVHQRYILAEHPTGVWLIEQHIAHERVLYEQVCDRWQIVPLASPLILNHLTVAQVEQLQRIGLDIEPFGETAWVVRTAPDLLAERPDCAAALVELSLGGDLQTAQVATACRSAIRNGTPLSLAEMQTLLNQWQQTRQPRTCPHGRPICLTLEESSLARFFRRHWVIGKSHGI